MSTYAPYPVTDLCTLWTISITDSPYSTEIVLSFEEEILHFSVRYVEKLMTGEKPLKKPAVEKLA